MINYPSTVSRSLDPTHRGLRTVVGQHDQYLSDADVNLIQDLQDWKRRQLVRYTAPSGCLSAPPFVFYFNTPNTFVIPAFDVLFRGEVLQVRGHNATNAFTNRVTIPAPIGGLQPGQLYAVFLELWYASLNPLTGQGYYQAAGQNFFYPYGCVSAGAALLPLFPDDSIDPSFNQVTTERAQLQWRLVVQPVPPGYNFTKHRYGLDPDPASNAQLFGQGANVALTSQGFLPLATSTGEATLWRAGGDPLNALGSMDGYSYAMPVAVLFQRTASTFDPNAVPYGCAGPSGGGLFASGQSGRFDARFADIVLPDDVIDTRLACSLTGYDLDQLMNQGVQDIFTGHCRSALTRSDCPAGATGTLLTQQVGLAPAATLGGWQNIQGIASFDEVTVNGAPAGGLRNGLSTDQRTYFTTLQVAAPSGGWGPITVALPASAPAGTVISSAFMQYPNTAGQIVPLMGTQLTVSGIGTGTVVVTPIVTPPSGSPLLITLGTTYPAASGIDLQKVPVGPVFGQLTDLEAGSGGVTLPVFGVSDYSTSEPIPPMSASTSAVQVYAPNYSSSLFGVRVLLKVANSSASAGSLNNTSVFSVPRLNLDGRFSGLYVTQALNASGASLSILSRQLSGPNMVITLAGPLDQTASTTLVVLCHQTAQAAINPAVRGAVALEETILISGGFISLVYTADLASAQDRRVTLLPGAALPGVISSSPYGVYTPGVGTTITGFVRGGRLRGISGDDSGDQLGLVWVMQGSSDQFVPTPCTLAVSVAGFTLTVPGTDLTNANWFVVASFLPALANSAVLILSSSYVPYQGEGVGGRSYQVLATREDGLVTTNGTGSAPIPGVQDVFPYDREFPIASTLPALSGWSDTDLNNAALGGSLDSNYDTKSMANIETIFDVPLRTNDFVPPLQGSIRRLLQLGGATGQGFSQIQPHVGFAILDPQSKNGLVLSHATLNPITLYVDNVNGRASNDGLSAISALPTVAAALALLPSILQHPVSILLQGNPGAPYALAALAPTDFDYSALEGGIYCLGNMAFTMQGAGSLTIGCAQLQVPGVTPVLIDGSGSGNNGMSWAGSAAFAAFVVASGRVVFDSLSFITTGSASPYWLSPVSPFGAVRIERAEVEFRNCSLVHPMLGVTVFSGAQVTLTDCTLTLGPNEQGVYGSESTLSVVNPTLTVANPVGVTAMSMTFFAVTGNGSLTLATDDGPNELGPGAANSTQETNFPSAAPYPTVAQAEFGSVILALPDFFTQGQAVLNAQSVLQVQGVSAANAVGKTQAQLIALQTQFSGVQADASSNVVALFN